MNTNRPATSSRLLGLALLLLPFALGCKPMMYPLARAFGSPSEAELAQCRIAFNHLKEQRATARFVVHATADPVGMRKGTYPGSAELVATLLRAQGFSHCVTTDAPAVEPTPLGSNQLRYVWTRAHAYGTWVATAKPEGDFHVIVEILAPPSGEVIGVHAYVIDAQGRVAFRRLMNSHQFGPTPPKDAEAACRLILGALLRNLEQPADQVFPPYGVG